MDLLLSEINNKRKDLQDPVSSGRADKYMRKGDIERAREEEERKRKAEEERKKREAREAREREKVGTFGGGARMDSSFKRRLTISDHPRALARTRTHA